MKTQLNTNTPKTKVGKEPTLKGTLASVLFLGFFLIFTWVSVYFLFLNRL